MKPDKRSSRNLVQLFVQPQEGEPFSFKIDLHQVTQVISWTSLVFLLLLWGTLFFFRELENNRKLQAEILETRLKLQLKTLSEPESLMLNRQLGYTVQLIEDQAVENISVSRSAQSETGTPKKPQDSWMGLGQSPVAARIGSLSSECQADNCAVKLELVPSGSGISQGELLIVLETEVPRIGSRVISVQQRKQFILYPGYNTRDEFSNTDISSLEKRPFKFSKTLSASLNFKVTKLLRPLAINVYLFDSRKNLTHHERKTIDLGEAYAN